MEYDFTLTTWAEEGAIKWERAGVGDWLRGDVLYPDIRGPGLFVIWYLYEGSTPEHYQHPTHIPCFAVGYGSPNDLYKMIDCKELRDRRIAVRWAKAPLRLQKRADLQEGMVRHLISKFLPDTQKEILPGGIPIPVPEPPSVGPTT